MENHSYSLGTQNSTLTQVFFTQVYSWMFAGLLTTGFFAYYTANSPAFLSLIYGNNFIFFGLIIVELGIVIALSAKIDSFNVSTSRFLFFVYSALNGLTMAAIFIIYTYESIATTFFITATTFGIMSIYGYVTKADLSKLGSILIMALIGLILATIVNIFLKSEAFMWVLTYAGILIFVGLTAYDTQKLKKIANSIENENTLAKISVIGALTLYLDFINLFLYLLRIFGKRR